MPQDVDKPIAPFYRQDTQPKNLNITEIAPSLNRLEITKNDPHYERDIARSIVYPTKDGYERYNRLYGFFSFDVNSKVWDYSDEEIEKTLKELIAKKYLVNPEDIIVRINRNTRTIHYQYLYYIKSAENEDLKVISIDLLEPGDIVLLNPRWLDVWPEAYRDIKKKWNLKIDDEWEVVRRNVLALIRSKGAVTINFSDKNYKQMLDYSKNLFLKRKLSKEERKRNRFVDEIETFERLPMNTYFAFTTVTENMKKSGMTYDMIFKKIGKDLAVNIKDSKMRVRVPANTKVMRKAEFEKEYKYKKDDLEPIFERAFSNYKTEKGPTGITVALLFEDFKKLFREEDLPYTKFDLLDKKESTTEGGRWVGAYKSENGNIYTWIHDKNEIKITKLGSR